jgi:glycosyltransferase involved in cell wall biosynthesis
MCDVSIVIPVKNEADNIARLLKGIDEACTGNVAFEILVVDDGSDDATAQVVMDMARTMPHVRLLAHDRSGGQSAAVHSGVQHARGAIVCTLDGDGQNPPSELPKLYAPFLAAGAAEDLGLVAGQRVNRQDTHSKKLASRFANGLRARLLNDGTRDTGCGLKAFRRDVFLQMPYFNHMHRYLPALFARDGWLIEHVDVSHAPRMAGRSKYSNLQRALVGIVDLFGVMWLQRRAKKVKIVFEEGDA